MSIINEHYDSEDCGCEQKTTQEEATDKTCISYVEEGCKHFGKASCMFYDGDSIPSLGIQKGMRMTQVILIIAAKIQELESA